MDSLLYYRGILPYRPCFVKHIFPFFQEEFPGSLCDKLVFERLRLKVPCHCEPVRLSGVAIPRIEGKCIDNCPTERGNVAISGGNRYLVPFNGGIATPVCALARNDSMHLQTPIY